MSTQHPPVGGTKVYTISARPKADVRLKWEWKTIYEKLNRELVELTARNQMVLDVQTVQLDVLEKVITTLFAYAAGVTEVTLVTYDVEASLVVQKTGAHLRSLNSATDELELQVAPHPHVVIYLTLALSPAHSLVRSKQALLDSMKASKEFFPEMPRQDDPYKKKERERVQHRSEAISTLLKKVPKASRADMALLVLHGLIATAKNNRTGVSFRTVKETIKAMRPDEFRTQEIAAETLAKLNTSGYIAYYAVGESQLFIKFTKKGVERIAALIA